MVATKQTNFPCVNPTTGIFQNATFGQRIGIFSLTEYATHGQLQNNAQPAFDQALIDVKTAQAAGSISGGIIYFPSGVFTLDQMKISPGVRIKGVGSAATQVTQVEGANKPFIISDPALVGIAFLHHSGVSDMQLKKKPTTTDTAGSAIEINCRIGELCHFARLVLTAWPQSGIKCTRGGQPVVIRDIHAFQCGDYALDLIRTSGDIWQMVNIDSISGDNHGKGLIHIDGGGAFIETVRISNIKAENITDGKMPCVLDFDRCNGMTVQIENVAVYAIKPVPAIIKVSTSTITISGGIVRAGGSAGASVVGLTSLVSDVPAAREVPYVQSRLHWSYGSTAGMTEGW